MGRRRGDSGQGSDEESITALDPVRVRTPQTGFSRIDTLPEDFFQKLSERKNAVGDIVGGRYQLLERLGTGAMGEVYVAENLAIGLKVAIKLVKNELLSDATFRHRFQHEAHAIAAIAHPNVARFLDLVVGDPTFLVMEYVPGPTIAARLRKAKQFPVERAVSIGLALCRALRAVHAADVVHRDLKPLNVILTPDFDEGETPKLLDFGLAKISGGATGLTHAGQLVGTPNYMSPEQIGGKDVDGRTDIYALGCLLFEMLAGRPPFVGKDTMQVLYQHVNEPAPTLRELLPQVPPAIGRVVARALEKDVEQRFATIGEMGEALATAVRVEPPPLVKTELVRLPPRRSRVKPVIAAALAASIALAVGLAVGRRRTTPAGPLGGSTLFIVTTPPEATVSIDGNTRSELTPTAIAGLGTGAHEVQIRHAGRGDVKRVIHLGRDERQVMELMLPPVSRAIEVRTVPTAATLYLDGKMVPGITPTSMTLDDDDDLHELRAEKLGYETLVRAVGPEDRDTLQLSLDAETQPRGTLFVDSNGAADVWVDGVFSGFTTPTIGFRVPVGTHTIEVHAAGMRPNGERVTVKRGETARLVLPLIEERGR